ncbi:SpoIIE family protein phosphatase [Streptomyces sp. NEAU-H22]|uniref:PP2C family protein-serine/threonine phosphatase n=1 Tax=unclassified Streptomyces TaxID=2593676 RepID=UPI00225561E9|nr:MULTISPECIES: SpoIIE family protein phosphatase [unclassified Streptomyces]MCX3290619.1 SpoIIE family protein phosphatase [Streptomyces sp. NEAU-H22]WMD06726.1 SpoIIE family protein phosphatase [Streptomyces sp. FXY-T5]
MPSHLSADRPAAQPPSRGSVDALISQTRRLKGEVDAVRRDAAGEGSDHPRARWQRALYDLALHQLGDLDEHLAQLRDGPQPPAPPEPTAPPQGSLISRVGSAEWNLLTDEASWSGELYQILGRDPAAPPLTLDELPSLVVDEDRPTLTAMVTDCLVDARPIDGEFRITRRGGDVRTVHMMGEPVLDTDGSTASMWAVLRDVSELRRNQRAVSEIRDSLHHRQEAARSEQRLAAELQEAVLPPWRGSLRLPHRGPRTLDLASRHLPASTNTMIGGDWYDALELTDGETLLSVGDLTGQGVGVTSNMTMLLGAVRGMAMAGAQPGQLMAWLNQLLDATVQPALGSAVCCRYRPATRTLAWAQAGHPAPLLFRDGTGRALNAPDGVLLGATSGVAYGQAEETLQVGDLLLLHTDGLVPGHTGSAAANLLLGLAPRLTGNRTAEDCVRTVVEEFGESDREDNTCVLVARVMS